MKDYPLLKMFQVVKSKGTKKIAHLIKIFLKEVPRLKKGLLSKDVKEQMHARGEIAFAFKALHEEVSAISAHTGKPIEMVWKEVEESPEFTTKDLSLLKSISLPRPPKIPSKEVSLQPRRSKRVRIRV